MKRIVAVVVLMGSMVAGSAQADTCGATVVSVAGTAYVVVDEVRLPDGEISFWTYRESNGIAGLQRDDVVCRGDGRIPGDAIIF